MVPLLQALLCEAEADALPKVTGRRTDAFHLTCQGLNRIQKKIKSEDPLRSTDLGMHSLPGNYEQVLSDKQPDFC